MSSLLDEALELDEPGRREWLAALGPAHEDIAEALREALSLGSATGLGSVNVYNLVRSWPGSRLQ